MQRELAAVDSALAGKPVEAEFDELAGLVRAIRAERPQPRSGFGAALDARVRQGFRAQKPTASLRQKRRRLAPIAAGAAATLLIGVTAVVTSGVLSGGSDRGPTASDGQFVTGSEPPATAPESKQGGGAVADQGLRSSAPAPPRGRVLPHVRSRQVERDAALTLASSPKEVEDTADGVIEVTDRYEGFVLRSNVTGGDGNAAGATLELRIPADRLQPALRDLSALAHVRSRTQSSQDITARFVSVRSRLRDAITERRALLRQLARATTPNESASIRARLRLANREIAIARSNLRGLRNRVGFSTVAVNVEADDTLPAGGNGWTPGEALDDAVGVLGVAAGVALISAAVLLPIAAIALLVLLAYRRVQRERRDRVLDF